MPSRHSRQETPTRAIARLFSELDPEAHEEELRLEEDHRESDADRAEEEERSEPALIPAERPVGVLGILGPQVREALTAVGDLPPVQDILPRSQPWRAGDVVPGTVIVIDRGALAEGPWAGVETASGTRLVRKLLSYLDAARDAGGQVVLLDHARPRNVNTNLLMERSDVILPDTTPTDEVLGDRPRTALMALLQQVAERQTRGSEVMP